MTPLPGDITLPCLSVLGSHMAFRETGGPANGPTALFLHGNPTSSFIWREIIPLVAAEATCIAPDLIGFGQSGKPDIEYSFFDHADYLDDFIEQAGISSAFLVAQDWGTGLAFHLAARRPDLVRGIAFMEFQRPFRTWQDFSDSPDMRGLFQAFRAEGVGERLVLDENIFVEQLLPGGTARNLSDTVMNVYRAPFRDQDSRRPMLRFPREIPVEGRPADVHAALADAHDALAASSYPKLLFVGDPGGVVTPAFADTFAASQSNLEIVRLSSGIHYLQEDHPVEIGAAIAAWIAAHAPS